MGDSEMEFGSEEYKLNFIEFWNCLLGDGKKVMSEDLEIIDTYKKQVEYYDRFIYEIQNSIEQDRFSIYNIKSKFYNDFLLPEEKTDIDKVVGIEINAIWFLLCLLQFDILVPTDNLKVWVKHKKMISCKEIVFASDYKVIQQLDIISDFSRKYNGLQFCGTEFEEPYSACNSFFDIFSRSIYKFILSCNFNKDDFVSIVYAEFEVFKNGIIQLDNEIKSKENTAYYCNQLCYFFLYGITFEVTPNFGNDIVIKNVANKKLSNLLISDKIEKYYLESLNIYAEVRKNQVLKISTIVEDKNYFLKNSIAFQTNLRLSLFLAMDNELANFGFHVHSSTFYNSSSYSSEKDEKPYNFGKSIDSALNLKIEEYYKLLVRAEDQMYVIKQKLNRLICRKPVSDFDMMDNFLDVMMIWEGILNDGSEIGFKLSLSMSKLMAVYLTSSTENKSEKCLMFYNKFNNYYKLRSKWLHGNNELKIKDIALMQIDELLMYTRILLRYTVKCDKMKYKKNNRHRVLHLTIDEIENIQM